MNILRNTLLEMLELSQWFSTGRGSGEFVPSHKDMWQGLKTFTTEAARILLSILQCIGQLPPLALALANIQLRLILSKISILRSWETLG